MTTPAAVLSTRRGRFWLSVLSGVVLAAGVAAVLVVFVGNTGRKIETPVSNKPAQVYKTPKAVPLEPAARVVAGRFIQTAVVRKNLAEAWRLAGPQLRAGLSYKEWLTGNIPVVPYLAAIGKAPIKVDHSYRDDALIEVLLLPAPGVKAKSQFFFMQLKAIGTGANRHWVVESWVPRANIAVPNGVN